MPKKNLQSISSAESEIDQVLSQGPLASIQSNLTGKGALGFEEMISARPPNSGRPLVVI